MFRPNGRLIWQKRLPHAPHCRSFRPEQCWLPPSPPPQRPHAHGASFLGFSPGPSAQTAGLHQARRRSHGGGSASGVHATPAPPPAVVAILRASAPLHLRQSSPLCVAKFSITLCACHTRFRLFAFFLSLISTEDVIEHDHREIFLPPSRESRGRLLLGPWRSMPYLSWPVVASILLLLATHALADTHD